MSAVPILVLDQAVPPGARAALDLILQPGDFALIEARDPERAAGFADLCTGLVAPASGSVRILGRDWRSLPRPVAESLRGRIGQVFGDDGQGMGGGGWTGMPDVATATMLAELHHTRRDIGDLRRQAAELARRFGLPGLPLGPPREHPPADLVRAACVRAFLCAPVLAILDSPTKGMFAELVAPLVNAIADMRESGGAVVWLSRSDTVWRDRSLPATHRLRLGEFGLREVRWREAERQTA